MITLALDTACETCAVGLTKDYTVLACDSVIIGKGHAEFLPEQIEKVMQQTKYDFNDVDRIAVNIGPGSFTGIRVGVASARGFALALQKPAIGVNNLEALAFETSLIFPASKILVVQSTAMDRFFTALFDGDDQDISKPDNLSAEELFPFITKNTILTGDGAKIIADLFALPNSIYEKSHADIQNFALLGTKKQVFEKPSPLYLRAPDAKPQAGFTIARKE